VNHLLALLDRHGCEQCGCPGPDGGGRCGGAGGHDRGGDLQPSAAGGVCSGDHIEPDTIGGVLLQIEGAEAVPLPVHEEPKPEAVHQLRWRQARRFHL